MKRIELNDYPWDRVEQSKAFIERLYSGEQTDRPGAVIHPAAVKEPRMPPDSLDGYARELWQATEAVRVRPVGCDDYVPALSTGGSTCAMATAFGCRAISVSGKQWVEPCLHSATDIAAVRKPRVADGRLGEVLKRTRAFAELADERMPIRVMDFQSPFTTCEQMLGSELFFTLPYDDPDSLRALMDVVTDFSIEFFQAQLEAAGPNACPGCWPIFWFPRSAGIQMSDDNLVNVSPEVYEQLVVPYNNRVAEAFGGLFLHSCTIRPQHVESVAKLAGLKGLNCDVSTSVRPAALLERFGRDAVVAPHAYINTDTNYPTQAEFLDDCLSGWRPGMRMFVYPCTILYNPATSRDIPCDAGPLSERLNRIPAWERDHTTVEQ